MNASSVVVGLDVGSTTTKVVVMAVDGGILGHSVLNTGGYFEDRAHATLDRVLADTELTLAQVCWITATGYGRLRVPGAQQVLTELSCHAKGAFYHVTRAMTVVDIGGQDNKFLSVDEHGRRGRSKMNRKCAAGTGAFIENAARQLGVVCSDIQALAEAADDPVEIGSFCTVFAGTEIIEHLRKGSSKENIARGVLRAVALRVFEMGRWAGEVVLTGGVAAYFPLVAEELTKLSGCQVTIPSHPQLAGALGAALYAQDALKKTADGETPGINEPEVEKGRAKKIDPAIIEKIQQGQRP